MESALKKIWTDDDFEIMGWHDCRIYGLHILNEIIFDIDYIFKWDLNQSTNCYSFWISPATLVFHNPHDLNINIDLDFINGLEIADLNREILNTKEFKWIMQTQEGDISFVASGYSQFIRKLPQFSNSQFLSSEQRNGYCFEKTTYK